MIDVESLKLLAVRNYALLEPGLHRGAQPIDPFEYRWLARLGVKRIVNLRAEAIGSDEVNSKGEGAFQFVRVPIVDDTAPTTAQADQFVALVRDKVPMFWHCHHGHGRTSTMSVLARLVRTPTWTLDQAIAEESTRFGFTFAIPEQLAFLHAYAPTLIGGHPHATV